MKNQLKNKRILISGANGFIGSHLLERLINSKAKIYAIVKDSKDVFRIKDFKRDIETHFIDITKYNLVFNIIRKTRPQIIFHLAAAKDVRRDWGLSDQMINVNLKGTVNLLRALIVLKVPTERFVNTGTCEEYGDGAVPFKEDQREKPVSPYSASKVAATYFCQMAHKINKIPVITLRPFLTYGSFQDESMFIPSVIVHCLKEKDLLMTSGEQTRDFNYIDNIVDAYLLACVSKKGPGEVINIGSGKEYRVMDVAEMIVEMMGSNIKILKGALPLRAGEARHFFCSRAKAERILGWRPKVNIEDGLHKTILWYKANWKEISDIKLKNLKRR